MKKFLTGMLCFIMMFCMIPAVQVNAEENEQDVVEINNTGDITDIEGLRDKLGDVADIEENGDQINIKLKCNIIGRISFAMPGKTIILDANGKTLDGGNYDEPICVNHSYINGQETTLVLTGDGTYLLGNNYTLYAGINGKIIVHSGTFDSNDKTLYYMLFAGDDVNAIVDEDNGYNCFVVTDTAGNKTTNYDNVDLSIGFLNETRVIVKQHKELDAWKTDENDHWKVCADSDCDEKLAKATHTYGDDNKCDVCGYEKEASAPEEKPTYSIIEGANSDWTQGTTETVTVRADGEFAKFSGVKVNDTLIDEKYYTAVSGSTVVTLKQEYLDTLTEGTYKLTVVFTDGECSTNFQIKKAAQTNDNESQPNEDTTTPPATNGAQTNDNENQPNEDTTTPPATNGVQTSPVTDDMSSKYVIALLISGAILIGMNVNRRKEVRK